MTDSLKPIGYRPTGLDGQKIALTSYHLDRAIFDAEHPVGVPVSGPVWMETATKRVTAAAPALNELSAYQHRYYEVDFRPGQDSSEPDQPVSRHVVELEKAQTWSSELVDENGERTGYHTVMLDIDHPVRVVPSSTEGHYHLYIDLPVKEEAYFLLLRALALAGVVEHGYYEASRARGGTHLRLPWIQKDRIRDKIQALGLLEATEKDSQLVWDGVSYAIPRELDQALRTKERALELTAEQQAAIDAYNEVQNDIHEAMGWGRPFDDPDDDDDEGDLLVDEAAETAALDRLQAARQKLGTNESGEIEFDAAEYSVVYVDGKGVLRKRS